MGGIGRVWFWKGSSVELMVNEWRGLKNVAMWERRGKAGRERVRRKSKRYEIGLNWWGEEESKRERERRWLNLRVHWGGERDMRRCESTKRENMMK